MTSSKSIELQLSRPRGDEPSWRTYGIILFPREHRRFFPGYKEPFEFKTGDGKVEAWVTSATKDVQIGDLEAGNYICSPRPAKRTPGMLSIKKWYEKHSELEPGDVLRITRLTKSLYRLRIVDGD